MPIYMTPQTEYSITFVAFLTKIFNLNVIMRKLSSKSKLWDILQKAEELFRLKETNGTWQPTKILGEIYEL